MVKKYFLMRTPVSDAGTSPEQIMKYRELVIVEMKRMGATEQEIHLVHENTIRNAIRNERKPEDVAWAILQ